MYIIYIWFIVQWPHGICGRPVMCEITTLTLHVGVAVQLNTRLEKKVEREEWTGICHLGLAAIQYVLYIYSIDIFVVNNIGIINKLAELLRFYVVVTLFYNGFGVLQHVICDKIFFAKFLVQSDADHRSNPRRYCTDSRHLWMQTQTTI